MKTLKYLAAVASVATLFASAQVCATIINFEDAPSVVGTPTDNHAVSNQYLGDGITFSGPHGVFIEKTYDAASNDSDPQGFLNDPPKQRHYWDKPGALTGYPAGTPSLGNWFLRTNGLGSGGGSGGTGLYLTISYTSAVNAASGQIWDIDGNGRKKSERWVVKAYAGSTLVDTETSPLGISRGPGSYNGLPWIFNLSSSQAFDKIEISFTGTKKNGLGLAFDNFNTNTATVPEPAALGIFGLGLALLGLLAGVTRRRWRND